MLNHGSSHVYLPIENDEQETEIGHIYGDDKMYSDCSDDTRHEHNRSRPNQLVYLAPLVLLVVLSGATITLYLNGILRIETSTRYSCGHSITEAQESRCIFDDLLAAWVHPACSDQELSAEFAAQGPWSYYADRLLTQDITSQREQLNASREVYATVRWHQVHCAYVWRKESRMSARRRRVHVSPHFTDEDDFHHVQHCQKVYEVPFPLESMGTVLHLRQTSCEVIKW